MKETSSLTGCCCPYKCYSQKWECLPEHQPCWQDIRMRIACSVTCQNSLTIIQRSIPDELAGTVECCRGGVLAQAAVQMCIMASLKGVPAAGSFLADFSTALRRAVKLEGVLLNPAPPGGDPCGATLWWYAPSPAASHPACTLVFL